MLRSDNASLSLLARRPRGHGRTVIVALALSAVTGAFVAVGLFYSPAIIIVTLGLILLASVILSGKHERVLGVALLGSIVILTSLPAGSLLGTSATYGGPSISIIWVSLALVRRGNLYLTKVTTLVGILTVLNLVSSVLRPPESIYYYVPVVLVFVFFLATPNMNADERVLVQRGILAVSVAESAIATIEMVLLSHPPLARAAAVSDGNPFFPGLGRAQATTGHPLVLGLIVVLGLAIALFGSSRIDRRFRLASFPALAAGLFFSGSIGPIIVAVVIVGIKIAIKLDDAARAAVAICLLLGTMVLVLSTAGSSSLSLSADQLDISHRVSTIQSLPALFGGRPAPEVVLGSGLDSPRRLYDQGLLNNDGFYAVDNQFIRTLIENGVIGVAILIGVMLLCWMRGDALARIVLVVTIVTFFSFDVLVWTAPSVAIVALIAPSASVGFVSAQSSRLHDSGPVRRSSLAH